VRLDGTCPGERDALVPKRHFPALGVCVQTWLLDDEEFADVLEVAGLGGAEACPPVGGFRGRHGAGGTGSFPSGGGEER
jgi:hypothetical protein